jgi:hypothetical protein
MKLNGKPINASKLQALSELKGFEVTKDGMAVFENKKMPLESFLKSHTPNHLEWLTTPSQHSGNTPKSQAIATLARMEEKRQSGTYRM